MEWDGGVCPKKKIKKKQQVRVQKYSEKLNLQS